MSGVKIKLSKFPFQKYRMRDAKPLDQECPQRMARQNTIIQLRIRNPCCL